MKYHLFQNIRKRIILFRNHLHFKIAIYKKSKFPSVVIHEKYKWVVKVLKYLLTLIGLISAFFTFNSVLIAFLFAIGIFLIIQFFDKIIFSYISLYIHPFPDFELDPEKWTASIFGYAKSNTFADFRFIVGWLFSDEDYAKNIHSLLLQWSYGKHNDVEKNICLSIVLFNNSYVFYCYPNPNRKTAKDFFSNVEKQRRQKSLTDLLYRFFITIVFGKRFKILEGSYLSTFINDYQSGMPFNFNLMVLGSDGKPRTIDGIEDFIFYDIKVRRKEDLCRSDFEYDLIRLSKH